MSVFGQTIVVRDVTAEDATVLGDAILDWLVEERIVEPEKTSCVLALDGRGHRPGRQFMRAACEPECSGVINMDYALFSLVQLNGVEIHVGRRMSVDNSGSYECAICPECRTERAVFDSYWNAAATVWMEGYGICAIACEGCGNAPSIADWDHREPLGFGALSFTFWDWPPLCDTFVQDFARRTQYRVILIPNHI